jgi:hypothetical protein
MRRRTSRVQTQLYIWQGTGDSGPGPDVCAKGQAGQLTIIDSGPLRLLLCHKRCAKKRHVDAEAEQTLRQGKGARGALLGGGERPPAAGVGSGLRVW